MIILESQEVVTLLYLWAYFTIGGLLSWAIVHLRKMNEKDAPDDVVFFGMMVTVLWGPALVAFIFFAPLLLFMWAYHHFYYRSN